MTKVPDRKNIFYLVAIFAFYCCDKDNNQEQSGEKWFIYTYSLLLAVSPSGSKRAVRAGAEERNIWAGSKAETRGGTLLIDLPFYDLLLLFSCITQDLLPRVTLHPSGLGSPTSIKNQENTAQMWLLII